MIKTFHLKTLTPSEVLNQVHRAGVIDYMFNWGHTIDDKKKSITFNIRYSGGRDEEMEKKMLANLEEFIASIDSD